MTGKVSAQDAGVEDLGAQGVATDDLSTVFEAVVSAWADNDATAFVDQHTTAIVVSRSGTLFPGETEVPADRWSLATWVLSRRSGRWLVEVYHDCPEN